MKALILFALLATACRPSPWTTTDSIGQGVVLASLTADYLQTRQIVSCAQTGEGCARAGDQESNPIMGERGERVPVPIYFGAIAAGHTAVTIALPQPWRRIAQVAIVALQAKVINHNLQAGYAISF